MINLRQKLPVSYLLFTGRGRISRSTYWHASLLIWCCFYIFYTALSRLFGPASTWLIYPPFFWSVFTLSSKRLHDVGKSGLWLALFLVPVLGPIYLFWQLLFRRGARVKNGFGPPLEAAVDYLKNDNGLPDPQTAGAKWIINDITGLNPVVVGKIARPKSVEE